MSEQPLAAASYPLRLGKQTFAATRLDDTDIAELDNWVRNQYIQTVRNSLAATASVAERKESLDIAYQTAATLSAFTGLGAKILATVDGMTRLCWQSIHRHHPNETELTLRKHLLEPTNVEEMNRVFKTLNMPATKKPKPVKTGKKGGQYIRPPRHRR